MKTIISMALFFSFFIGSISAQSIGARAGANLATITSDEDDNSTIFAWQLGPLLDLELSEYIDLNVAFLYSRKGTKDELEDATANTDYLEFPALLRYHIEPILFRQERMQPISSVQMLKVRI